MLESSKSQTGKLRRTSGQKVKLLHGTSGRSGGSTERFNKEILSKEVRGKSSNCKEKAKEHLRRQAVRAGSHRVEAVIDEMLQVLAHADLPHKFVLVTIHASQLPHVGKYILQSICQLQ